MTRLNYNGYEEYLIEEERREGYHYIFKFDNNFGASVIKSPYSYGGEEDLFELAVLRFSEDGGCNLTYDTPITDDVKGYLSNEEVIELLEAIKNL